MARFARQHYWWVVRFVVAAGEAGAVFGKFGMESRFSPESA